MNITTVKVTAVVQTGKKTYQVFFEYESANDWRLADAPTLGGLSVGRDLTSPRALTPDGRPRFDVFTVSMSKANAVKLNVPGDYPLTIEAI